MTDTPATAAQIRHQWAQEATLRACEHRKERDRLIRQLRDEAPEVWTYSRLAAAVGCSPELIAHIIRTGRDHE